MKGLGSLNHFITGITATNSTSMKYVTIAIFLFMYSQHTQAQLYSAGSMSEMGKTNYAPAIRLDTLSNSAHLYAIGPYGKMQGEITVFDGVPMIASVHDGALRVEQKWDAQAPFFVYQNVPDWRSFKLEASFNNVADIQQAVSQIAEEKGYDLAQPFAFRIRGNFAEITTHVVMPRSPNVNGYVEGKKQELFTYQDIAGEILGFYSQEGQGIYTGNNTNIHVHFRSKDMSVMGHLDALKSTQTLTLHLPARIAISSAPKVTTNDTDFSKGRLGFQQNIELNDLIKFHGHLCDGLVIGHLALQQALRELYPEGPIDRTNTRIVSKPSPCLTDAAVYLTGGRYQFNTFYVDTNFAGLYIVQRIDNQQAVLVSMNKGVKPTTISRLGKLAVQQELSPCDIDRLKSLEDDFSAFLLKTNPDKIFTVQKIPDFTWKPNTKHDYIKTDVLNKNMPDCRQ